MNMRQPRANLGGLYFYQLQAPVPAGIGSLFQTQVQVNQGWDFLVKRIQTVSDGIYSVQWGTATILFMPDFQRSENIFGTGVLPHDYDPAPLFPAGSAIVFKFRNETAPANTVNLAIEGEHVTKGS